MSENTELALKYQQLLHQNRQLAREKDAAEKKAEHFKRANIFKWALLLISFGISTVSLIFSTWSVIDEDREGLNEAGVVLSTVSLLVSMVGIFHQCCRLSFQEDIDPNDAEEIVADPPIMNP